MKATLHSIESVNWTTSLEDFVPVEEAFEVTLEYYVTWDDDSHDHEILDLYRIWVTSPAFIQQQLESGDGPVLGRHRLITDGWRAEDIEDRIRRAVEACQAETTASLMDQLSTIGYPVDRMWT